MYKAITHFGPKVLAKCLAAFPQSNAGLCPTPENSKAQPSRRFLRVQRINWGIELVRLDPISSI